jgi:uncharacterized lipoprotein YajG
MHLLLIETFLLEQDDPLEKNYSITQKVKTIFFTELSIMQYILDHVLSHLLDQMLNDQELTLVNDV